MPPESECSTRKARRTSSGARCGATWATSATWCFAIRRREKERPVPGSSWRAAPDTYRPTRPASSTASSTASAVEVGCWSHARRKLTELQDRDCRVAYPLKLIARLYRLEHLADAKGLSPDERVALRQERSPPVLEKVRRWWAATYASEPPASDFAKAAAYMTNHWIALTRFVQDGRLKLDNNLCEQQLRAIALCRNNFLFFCSHHAAEQAAVLYSLTRTCALHGVSPLVYLADVLRKLAAGWPQSRIDELLPGSWPPTTPAP